MADTTRIEVRVFFTRDTSEGEIHDCLIYQTDDFYQAPQARKVNDAELAQAITARVSNWVVEVQQAKINEQNRPEPTLDEEFGHLQNDKLAELKAWIAAKGI